MDNIYRINKKTYIKICMFGYFDVSLHHEYNT